MEHDRESADKTKPYKQVEHCRTDGVMNDHWVLTYPAQLAIGVLMH